MPAESSVAGTAAGVPYLAVPPDRGPRPDAPVVLAWHLLDPPRTEVALAAALPLAGLDAWRVYLGLPLTGARLPAGGPEELMRLAVADAVRNVQGPVAAQAAAEAAPALAELRGALDLGDGPVGLLGGSIGGAVAQLVLAEGLLSAAAAVLVNPLVQLRPVVDAFSAQFGMPYTWTREADEIAGRLDFVARADEIAARGEPPLLVVLGADDLPDAFHRPAERLRAALAERYADPGRVVVERVPGLAHALAEEPGVAPAPQLPAVAAVDRLAVGWLARHLST